MKIIASFVLALLLWQNSYGQVTLEGKVSNAKGEALPDIHILVYPSGSNMLIAFAISNSEGRFRIMVNSPSDSLCIETSSINYKNERRRIANVSQTLQFKLIYGVKELKGVVVKATPIEKRGDTLSYLVKPFTHMQERTIGDVLKNMPGIEVESSGRILYQGMPIQKFYVEGLDLMGGRYGVVSNNLPAETVSTVEIYENHQPIRILEDRVTSHQASLNLKLKRGITTTGTAKLGAGISPLLWDVNLTPMTFTKKFQVVASYQANNTGDDVSNQLNTYTLEDLLQDIPAENSDMLKIQGVSLPDIAQNRYLDNNIHLLNFNGLQHISNDIQLRGNLYYINDIQREHSTLQRTIYTPVDTLQFTEQLNNHHFDNYLQGEFTLSRNVKSNYLNNKLKIQSGWDRQSGLAYTGGENINQSLKKPFQSISNELRSINPVGAYLVEFRSLIMYNYSPHRLTVEPGMFEDALNQGEIYDMAKQELNLQRFYTDNSAGFTFGWKRLVFTPRVGIAYRQQTLESKILITQQGTERIAGSDFSNNLDGTQTRTYLQTDIECKLNKITFSAGLPLNWQHVNLNDTRLNQKQELTRLCFDPSLSVDYSITGFWRLRSSWTLSNKLGDIDMIHYGFILGNYRDLSLQAAPVSKITSNNFSLSLSYRNPIISFFNSLNYIYSISNNNLTYSSIVQNDGTTIVKAIYLPQTAYTHYLTGYTSKFFTAIKTTLSLRANYNQRQGKTLMNDELLNTKTLFYNFKPDINIRLFQWLTAEYNLNSSYIETFIDNERKSNISMLSHNLIFFVSPNDNHLVSLTSEYYDHEGNTTFFGDVSYRYTILKSKKKVDFELKWNNIFNNKTYTTYQASSFTVWKSTYDLRPSQVMLSAKFSF